MATKVKLIADGVITPDQITLTTASTGTNTTAPATTAFVQQEISALVDSSPDALNTLNELAAALGDDANFSTTVTNSIATKLPLAGGTLTGTLNINNSSGYGNIELGGASGGFVDFKTPFSDDHDARIIYPGGYLQISTANDEPILLKHNNVDKLVTSSAGIAITGRTLVSDDQTNDWIKLEVSGTTSTISLGNTEGTAATAQWSYNRASGLLSGNIGAAAGTNFMTVKGTGNIGFGTDDPDGKVHILKNSAGTVSAATDANTLVLEDTNTGMTFLGSNTSVARIRFGDADANARGQVFYNHSSDSFGFQTAGSTKLVLTQDGELGLGITNPSDLLDVRGDGADTYIRVGSDSVAGNDSARIGKIDSSTDFIIQASLGSTSSNTIFKRNTTAETMRIRDDGGIAIGENNAGYAGQILSVKSGTGDLVMYGESSDASCGISLRDNSSSLNITWAAEGNDHVLKKDATVYMRVYASGDNLALGHIALESNTSGVSNTGIGTYALRENTSGGYNTAIGAVTLRDNLTGSNLTAVGYGALVTNTGSNNTGVGYKALHVTTTGENNTAVGSSALLSNTTGQQNVAVGTLALDANTSANDNTAVGYASLSSNTEGAYNTAMGRQALWGNTTASNNTAVGYKALLANTTGAGNTAVGSQALDSATTAANNTAVGYLAGTSCTTGNHNAALGSVALQNGDVTDCVAVGAEALRSCSGNRNIGIGKEAGRFITGADNVIIGNLAGDASTFSGSNNVGIGSGALGANTTAGSNVAVGVNAGASLTTGNINVAIGHFALDASTNGQGNVAIGYLAASAMNGSNGKWNVAIGYNAMRDTDARFQNTAVGQNALLSNLAHGNTAVGSKCLEDNTHGSGNNGQGYFCLSSCTTGDNNVAMGTSAGTNITTSSNNTCFGAGAGDVITTGGSNTCIGYGTDPSSATGTNQIVLGNGTVGHGNNKFTFGQETGNSRVYNAFQSNASWTRVSDERYKEEIQDNTDCGLDFINDLRPVTFKWKAKADIDNTLPDYQPNQTKRIHDEKMYGLIAQEVKESLDKHNITDFGGWDIEDKSGIQSISQEMFVHPLIKAVQELSSQVDELKQEIKTLKGE